MKITNVEAWVVVPDLGGLIEHQGTLHVNEWQWTFVTIETDEGILPKYIFLLKTRLLLVEVPGTKNQTLWLIYIYIYIYIFDFITIILSDRY